MTDLRYLPATTPEFCCAPVSIVGKTFDDVTAFRIAAAHEDRMPWLDMPKRRPGL